MYLCFLQIIHVFLLLEKMGRDNTLHGITLENFQNFRDLKQISICLKVFVAWKKNNPTMGAEQHQFSFEGLPWELLHQKGMLVTAIINESISGLMEIHSEDFVTCLYLFNSS